MWSPSHLPDSLPLFPLPGALLLPRSTMPLHIFEPRYLAMLERVLGSTDRLIGMVQPYGPDETLHRIGCAGRVISFSETPDGRCMIVLKGISRFRLVAEQESFTPYRQAQVSWDGFDRDTAAPETDPGLDRDQLLQLLDRYLSEKALSTDWDSVKDAEAEVLINALSMLCPFSPEDKQALLEAPSLATRRETLITLIQFALRGADSEDRLQ